MTSDHTTTINHDYFNRYNNFFDNEFLKNQNHFTFDESLSSSSLPPMRPLPPDCYLSPSHPVSADRTESVASSVPPRPAKPPKLEHVLICKKHDLRKAQRRPDDRVEVHLSDYEDYDLDETEVDGISYPLSEAELDKIDSGETPKGDKSMLIKTDHGLVKSKYNYLGFGLWENTEPSEKRPPFRKPSPPPPPPKAEPIWYSCTVSIERHSSSKELDDLVSVLDIYNKISTKAAEVEIAPGYNLSEFPGRNLWETLNKEDMSEMFRRAFLEQMSAVDGVDKSEHKCCVCSKFISGRLITAMSRKFHPECFVCSYCRKPFKNRIFKADEHETAYCYDCFDRLLGHYGDVRDATVNYNNYT